MIDRWSIHSIDGRYIINTKGQWIKQNEQLTTFPSGKKKIYN